MILDIGKIIYDLLQFRRSNKEATEKFVKLKHNADLCPKIQQKLELAFNSFEKYRRITYDIQGPSDEGSDIIIRQVLEDENYFICFQIKSENDFLNKDWLKILKSQWFDTDKNYKNLIEYYILLCCNTNDIQNKTKIRTIESTFSQTPKVYIIEPEFVLSFLRMSLTQIDAIVKSKFGAEDIVFRNGLSIISDLTPSESVLLFHLIWSMVYFNTNPVSPASVFQSAFVNHVYETIPDYERGWFFEEEAENIEEDQEEYEEYEIRGYDLQQRIISDLEFLQDTLVRTDEAGNYVVNLSEVQPLVILMMDGNERYGYYNDELLFYMMDLFGPRKGYESREDEGLLE